MVIFAIAWLLVIIVVVVVVARISLNGACSAGESCLADNAECLGGICQCRPGFYSVAGDCGQCFIDS